MRTPPPWCPHIITIAFCSHFSGQPDQLRQSYIYFFIFLQAWKIRCITGDLNAFFSCLPAARWWWEQRAFKEHPWEKLRLPFILTAYVYYIYIYIYYTYPAVAVGFFYLILINWHNYRSILLFFSYFYFLFFS